MEERGITMRLAIKSNRAEGQMQDEWARRKLYALLMGRVLMRSISRDDHSSREASWNLRARKATSFFLSYSFKPLSPYSHHVYRVLPARGCRCWPSSDCASPRRKCNFSLDKQARTQEYLGNAPPVRPYQPTQAARR